MIRKIHSKDNKQIEEIIKASFVLNNLPLTGSTYEDKSLSVLSEVFEKPGANYFVIEVDGKIMGGAGYKALEGADASICEIQKMYFHKDILGKGYGKKIFEYCLQEAIKDNYKQAYLETIDTLKAAIYIYEKFGFRKIENRLGATKHNSCEYFMLKDLV